MRQVGTFFTMYAQQYKDAVPIGYMSQKQFSYVIHWNNAGSSPPKPSQMGLLAIANMLPAPNTYYCPVETDPFFTFDSPENQWVFYKGGESHPWRTTPGSLRHTRMGYNARPIADWPTNEGDPATTSAAWIPKLDPDRIPGFPKAGRLKGKAILADLVISPGDVTRRHKK